jgi:rhamnose transport system substrate-binding protein
VAELKGKGVNIDFLYTGPSVANTDEEIRMIDDLVAQQPDAIIISPNNADAMVHVAQKAKTSGIKVITYDADVADPTARQWFVNQGTFTLVGAALVDVLAEQAGASARFAVVSTDPGAFSQNSWIVAMKAQMQAKYSKMQLVDIRYGLGKPRSTTIDICLLLKYLDVKVNIRDNEQRQVGIVDGRKWRSRFPGVVEGGARGSDVRRKEHH